MDVTSSGIVCVDKKSKKFLVMQSKFNDKKWSFPKGYLNKNENIIDAALRELYEETLISLTNKDLLNKTYIIRVKLSKPTKKLPNGIKVIKFWVAYVNEDTPIQLSREHSKFEWVEDLNGLDMADEFTELQKMIKSDLFE